MEKPHYFAPKYPPRHSVMEESMGRFLLVWSILEIQLDSGIAALLCIDSTLGLTITANLGTKAKLDILHSIISMSGKLLDTALCDRGHTCLDKIADLSGRHRNTLAHGSVIRAQDGWRWHRMSARKSLDVKYYYAPATRWKKAATEVRKATRDWCRIYQEMWHILAAIPQDDRDEAYTYTPRSSE
jgi:hypothetical protein